MKKYGKRNPNNVYFHPDSYRDWQQGNHAIELYSNKFMQQKLDYIHNNPVEALIVSNPEDYIYRLPGLIEVEFIQ